MLDHESYQFFTGTRQQPLALRAQALLGDAVLMLYVREYFLDNFGWTSTGKYAQLCVTNKALSDFANHEPHYGAVSATQFEAHLAYLFYDGKIVELRALIKELIEYTLKANGLEALETVKDVQQKYRCQDLANPVYVESAESNKKGN
jgi:23S rRNA maturation mini-RNase III